MIFNYASPFIFSLHCSRNVTFLKIKFPLFILFSKIHYSFYFLKWLTVARPLLDTKETRERETRKRPERKLERLEKDGAMYDSLTYTDKIAERAREKIEKQALDA